MATPIRQFFHCTMGDLIRKELLYIEMVSNECRIASLLFSYVFQAAMDVVVNPPTSSEPSYQLFIKVCIENFYSIIFSFIVLVFSR